MNTRHFVLGGNMTDAQWNSLASSIKSYYPGHIPGAKPFQVTCYKYTDDVYSMINVSNPIGPIVIAGHSFGGTTAVAAAVKFGARHIDKLILFDPVDPI